MFITFMLIIIIVDYEKMSIKQFASEHKYGLYLCFIAFYMANVYYSTHELVMKISGMYPQYVLLYICKSKIFFNISGCPIRK